MGAVLARAAVLGPRFFDELAGAMGCSFVLRQSKTGPHESGIQNASDVL